MLKEGWWCWAKRGGDVGRRGAVMLGEGGCCCWGNGWCCWEEVISS